MSDKCPTQEELSGFVHGTLSGVRTNQIAEHVHHCESCDATIERLGGSADTFVGQLDELEEPKETNQESAAASVSIGKTIRDYKLILKLGEGGMGAVYKALHTKLHKSVALKVLPAERLKDKDAVMRFEREMRAVGKLEHKNIVRALDAGEEDGIHYLVMELVEGGDLAALIRRKGTLPVDDACEYIRQAARGLQYAHQHGLVHRDIKPSNLMLCTAATDEDDNAGPTVKILDMGLALLDEMRNKGSDELTGSGRIMGTLNYMAPEQGSNSHDVDIRADIYSLGATLYKLLCGTAPFEGKKYDTPLKQLMALATSEPDPIADRRGDVPMQLANVVHCMLAKSPGDRFATPSDVAEVLSPFIRRSRSMLPSRPSGTVPSQQPEPPPAPPASDSPSAKPAARPRPKRKESPDATPASGVDRAPPKSGSSSAISVTPDESPRDRFRKKTKKKSSKLVLICTVIAALLVIGLGVTLAVVMNREDSEIAAADAGEDEASDPGGGQEGETVDGDLDDPEAAEPNDPSANPPIPPADPPTPLDPIPDVPMDPPDEGTNPQPQPLVADPRPLLSAPPNGEETELLSIIDLQQDFSTGNWQQTDDELVSPGTKHTRLQVPVELPPEYDLKITLQVDRKTELQPALVLGLGASGNSFNVVLDASDGRCGLELLGGMRYNDNNNPTNRAVRALEVGKQNVVQCRVRSTGIVVLCNGMQVIKWQGDLQELAVPDTGWKTPSPEALMISGDSLCRISSIKLINGGIDEPFANLHLAHREIEISAVEIERLPVPDATSVKSKRAALTRSLKDELAEAKTAKQLKLLALSLRDRGLKSDDSTERYAYLLLASSAADKLGDVGLKLSVADNLTMNFAVDDLTAKISAIEEIVRQSKRRDTDWDAGQRALQLLAKAIERDRYDEADNLLPVIRNVARKTQNSELATIAAARGQQVKAMRIAHEQAREALQLLKDDPNDADANSAAGEFLCLSKAHWDRGLALLSKGSNTDLKAIADTDLAFPVDAVEQAALGDAWWEIGAGKTGQVKQHAELRALRWYELALRDLVGGEADTVKDRVQSIRKSSPSQAPPIVDYSNVNQYAILTGHRNAVFDVAFSPDGWLATASDDGLVKVWDVRSVKELLSLKGHRDGVTSVTFSWDGKILASASKDGSIILWDALTGRQIKRIANWAVAPYKIEFAPNSYLMTVVFSNNQAVLLSPMTETEYARFPAVNCAAFSPDGRSIAAPYGHQVKVWALTGEELDTLSGHSNPVGALEYFPDGRILASIGTDNIVHLWNSTSGESDLRVAVERFYPGTPVRIAPDGKTFATSDGGTIKMWQASDGSAVSSVRVGSYPRADLSPDGRYLAVGNSTNTIQIFAFATDISTPYPDNVQPALEYKLRHHPADAVKIGNHWYKVNKGGGNWAAHAQWCKDQGGYLACVDSQEEALALAQLAAGKPMWLGGIRNQAGQWSWITGSSTPIRYWSTGEPKVPAGKQAVLVLEKDGRWSSFDRGDTKGNAGCICEWEF
jgi:serine/threonine protein kinase/WD40 repeat protein